MITKENVQDPETEIVVIEIETVIAIAIVEIEEIVIGIEKETVTEKGREIVQGVDQKNVVVLEVLQIEDEKSTVNLTLKVVYYHP